jgi:hypothetical protein
MQRKTHLRRLPQETEDQTLNVNSDDEQFLVSIASLVAPLGGGLGDQTAMSLLGCKEGSRLVGLVLAPEGVDDPDPHITQRAHRHAVRFAFFALALIVGFGPGFLKRAQPEQIGRAHCARV